MTIRSHARDRQKGIDYLHSLVRLSCILAIVPSLFLSGESFVNLSFGSSQYQILSPSTLTLSRAACKSEDIVLACDSNFYSNLSNGLRTSISFTLHVSSTLERDSSARFTSTEASTFFQQDYHKQNDEIESLYTPADQHAISACFCKQSYIPEGRH